MKRISLLFGIILLAGMLAACETAPAQQSSAPAGPASQPAAAATPIPQPAAGQSAMRGQLISKASGKPLAQTLVRLADYFKGGAPGQGTYLLDDASSPGTTTDDSGTFVFSNLKAGQYVMVLGDVNTEYLIVPDEAGKLKIWNAEADKVVDIGKLTVNFGQ